MTDLASLASLATAGGTLVLAIATFGSVRSANRAARVAERSLLAGMRPVLAPTRLDDPMQKITWGDGHWTRLEGGRAGVELTDDVVYLSFSLRNAGNGIAVLHGWHVDEWRAQAPHADPEQFQAQQRDLYVPSGDIGFWQGALRDPEAPVFTQIADLIRAGERIAVELLYSDHEGGQRAITRFSLSPAGDGIWLAQINRHWNLDRPDPR